VDELRHLRDLMAAAAKDARRARHIEVVDTPEGSGVSAAELADFQQHINDTIDWFYEQRAEMRYDKGTILVAAAFAIGIVAARECPPLELEEFCRGMCERLIKIARSVRECEK